MEFARNILKKYGWEEGKGLGKKEDGINKALKPKLKFDTAGLGHDPGEQFTNKWWESAYNSAANNIDVINEKSKVKIKKHGDIEISTKKKMNWRKSSEQSEEDCGPSSSGTQAPTRIVQLTDEELFAACGGLTAHKGARHGLKLSGKLKRVQEQEVQLGSSHTEANEKNEKSKQETAGIESVVHARCEDASIKITRKRKKSKNRRDTEMESEETVYVEQENNSKLKSKEKKRTKFGKSELDGEIEVEIHDLPAKRKKKKKTKST